MRPVPPAVAPDAAPTQLTTGPPVRSQGRPDSARILAAAGGVLTALAVVIVVVMGRESPSPDPDLASPASTADLPASLSTDGSADGIGEPFGTMIGAQPAECRVLHLECEVIEVPVDQRAPGSGETLAVRFGRHVSDSDARIGTLVVATGGPGTSGIALSEHYLRVFPDGVFDRYDVVFFEQRGVGGSARISCRHADAAAPDWAEIVDLPLDDALASTSDWVDTCLAEADVQAARLDGYSTFQAAADLDAYLDHIGAGRVVIYGESYGTQLAQVYAAQRPERIEGLILDAVVDPSLDQLDYAVQQTEGFSDVLDLVLASCAEDPVCSDDFPSGGAAGAWDRLAAELEIQPLPVQLPIRGGGTREVQFRLGDLVRGTAQTMYTERERAVFLRALAWAARDDLRPLVRLSALVQGLDPETGEPDLIRPRSNAAFHAIGCQGWSSNGEQNLVALRAILAEMREFGLRLADLLAEELPCFGGFAGTKGPDVTPTGGDDYPILVLTSTADPATPTGWAENVAERTSNAYVLVTQGSSHGTFGWGFHCPDEAVKEFLIYGDLPAERRTNCEGGYLIDPYRPLPLGGPEAYPDVLDALIAAEEIVSELPDYVYWDGFMRRIGCPHDGWLEMSWDEHDIFKLYGCELLAGWPMDGTVTLRADFSAEMQLRVPNGTLEYTAAATGRVSVTGILDGEQVRLSR